MQRPAGATPCPHCGAAAGAAGLIGQLIAGKFRILSELGSGAMGTIFKAEQVALKKPVAVKVLHRHLLTDRDLAARFQREALAASRLNHPNCVQVLDFGALADGSLYLVMEFIEGVDLAVLLEREQPLPFRRVVHIMEQVCTALDEAHANGVLHRDLKLENIMVEERRNAHDFVKVVDFGIAKIQDNAAGGAGQFQTRAGLVCGTPEYMSPEQARGQTLDARSDLYAIGVMLFHLVTNSLPFEGDSAIEIVSKHLSEAPPDMKALRPDLPDSLAQLIATLLEKDRERRPGSALDVRAELERIGRELGATDAKTGKKPRPEDDATQVDLRGVSERLAAMAGEKAWGLGDDANATRPEGALEYSGNDIRLKETVREDEARLLALRIAEATRQELKERQAPSGLVASSGLVAPLLGAVAPVASAKRPSSGGPDASLANDRVTIEARALLAADVVESRGAGRWVVLGVGAVVVLGLVAWGMWRWL